MHEKVRNVGLKLVIAHCPRQKARFRHLTIPWQVALPQSLLPLGQVILHYFHSRLFQIFLHVFW